MDSYKIRFKMALFMAFQNGTLKEVTLVVGFGGGGVGWGVEFVVV